MVKRTNQLIFWGGFKKKQLLQLEGENVHISLCKSALLVMVSHEVTLYLPCVHYIVVVL